MSQSVNIKRTTTVAVTASKITAVHATNDVGAQVAVNGPVSVGDYHIIDANGAVSILSAADYEASVVTSA